MFALLLACNAPEQPGTEPFQGVVEFDERRLGFERPGRLAEVFVAENDSVEAGERLARLDDELPVLERELRTAQLEAAQGQLALVSAGARSSDVRAVASELRAARANVDTLEDELARNEGLRNTGAVPLAQVDRLRGELERARGIAGATASRLTSIRSGPRSEELSIAAAQVEAAEVAVRVAERGLAQHEIRSPIAGKVLALQSEPGEVVGAGSVVLVLVERDHPYVDVFVPQDRVGELTPGASVHVRVDAYDDVLLGRVEHVGSELEYTPRFLFSESERPNLVLRVRVRVEDPDHILLAGLPAFVTPVN